eukprot:515480-Rhodomonas_salina.1
MGVFCFPCVSADCAVDDGATGGPIPGLKNSNRGGQGGVYTDLQFVGRFVPASPPSSSTSSVTTPSTNQVHASSKQARSQRKLLSDAAGQRGSERKTEGRRGGEMPEHTLGRR